MKYTRAKDVQAFFERVATDWDMMCLSYYDVRFFVEAGLEGHGYESLGMQ